MKPRHLVFSALCLMVILLSACNIPKATQVTQVSGDDPVKTAAAQTVAALTTQIAGTDIANRALTPSPQPTNTSSPTDTPQLTNTPLPTSTNTPIGVCDQAGFVTETVEDNSDFAPNKTFTKTWTVKNTGTCTWNSSYAVVFTSGNNAMGAPAAKQLTTGTVEPGQTIVISMDLTTPSAVGNYKAEFKLRNANGVIFGFGVDNRSFWVQIDVVVSSYNFATNACLAIWTSNVGTLPCPGTLGNINGYILVDAAPKLESGYQDNEPAIWMGAPDQVDSWIKGVYPAVTVTQGMFFQTILGCHPDATNCNVHIRLNYIADGGPEQNLLLWTETNDGTFKKVKSDISSLAGKSVQFIFIVEAYGNPDDDLVHWFMPVVGP